MTTSVAPITCTCGATVSIYPQAVQLAGNPTGSGRCPGCGAHYIVRLDRPRP